MTEIKVDGKHGGTKMDGDKAQYGLLPPDSLKAVAEVMTSGAKKYSANNWVNLEISRVMDALERHINAFKSGEEYAEDSGQHHLAHAMANTMMAYHIVMNKPAQDDRLFKYITPTSKYADMHFPDGPGLDFDGFDVIDFFSKGRGMGKEAIAALENPVYQNEDLTSQSQGKGTLVETLPEGTYACPHCGLDKPHTHTVEAIAYLGRKAITVPGEAVLDTEEDERENAILDEEQDNRGKSLMLTEDEIVEELANEPDAEDILDNSREDLIYLHHSLGQYIRNTYNLWAEENPLTKPFFEQSNAVKNKNVSLQKQLTDIQSDETYHPDSVSQRIIEKLYDTLKARKERRDRRPTVTIADINRYNWS